MNFAQHLSEGLGRVRAGEDGSLRPETPVYRMKIVPRRAMVPPRQVRRGWVVLDGPARSLADRAWRSVASVLIRESGF